MNITDIKIRLVEGNEKLKGYATIVFDDVLVVHNIKIISADDGLFIAMPSRKMNDGDFKDVVHPISKEYREFLTNTIIEQYRIKIATN